MTYISIPFLFALRLSTGRRGDFCFSYFPPRTSVQNLPRCLLNGSLLVWADTLLGMPKVCNLKINRAEPLHYLGFSCIFICFCLFLESLQMELLISETFPEQKNKRRTGLLYCTLRLLFYHPALWDMVSDLDNDGSICRTPSVRPPVIHQSKLCWLYVYFSTCDLT